ncbi:MAG: ATP-binding protein [Phycisphaerae bacterium]
MSSILVIQGPDKGRTYELREGESVIGRLNCPVSLGDRTVSRSHARLVGDNGNWVLEDLGSANGTFLNGVRLKKPLPLQRGDQIRCGSTLMVFGGGKTSPAAAVDVDEEGQLVDAAIVATVPSNEDSVVIPTPEAGKEAIGNLRILYDLIAEIGSIFNVDLILQRTLNKIFEVMKVDRAYIMLAEQAGAPAKGGKPATGTPRLVVRASRQADETPGQKSPISRTIINEVMANQVGVLSTNAMTDKRFASGKSVHNFGIRSAICVPIKGRDKILGVIHVDCGVADHTYSTEQLRLLTAVGYQAGLAIENVRLYESAVQSERLAAVGETVAFLSHHIKNILQALGAGADVVEMGLKGADLAKASGAWPIVQRNLGRINDLILNMLAFSKSREPLIENVNVNFVLKECLELVTPRADERSVAVINDLDDVPPIPADSAGLQQAFMNLLTNALEAVADGTGAITVASQYDSMNRNVIVRVSDNGAGIEPEKLDRIFTPFFSTKGQSGTGLGLAVTQKIVREHRGRIQVVSKPKEGTTFTITLPAMSGKDAAETDHSGK